MKKSSLVSFINETVMNILKESRFTTIGDVLQGCSEEFAIEYLHSADFSDMEEDEQNILNSKFIDSYNGIDLYYDPVGDYYFFAVSNEEGELSEGDEFITHGVADSTNLGGSEVQISDSGDAARFRHYGGEPTDWYKIQFDEDGVAYVDCGNGNVERLDRYMRI